MKIGLFPRDSTNNAVVRLRLIDPLGALPENEIRFGYDQYNRPASHLRYDLEVLNWADVLVVQRAFPGPDTNTCCNMILNSGKPVVYETDDLLETLPHYAHCLPFIRKFETDAALVTTTTAALAQHLGAFNKNVAVLPNYLNDRHWRPFLVNPLKRRNRRVRIGYVGSVGHEPEINSLTDVLMRLAEKHTGIDWFFIGCKSDIAERLPGATLREGQFSYDDYPALLQDMKLDIGLAPMLPTPLNQCRSPVKYFDYAIVGAACVASAGYAYDTVIEQGASGYLCTTQEEWFTALDTLVTDAKLRRTTAMHAQTTVLENWMLSRHAHRWRDEYEKLLSR